MANGVISRKMLVFFTLLGLGSLVNSYLITQPDDSDETCFGHRKTVRWTSVNTDPPVITISIVNNDAGTYPTGMSRIIKSGIHKYEGRFVIPSEAFHGLKEGEGYQINILTKDAGAILAQSPQFTLSSWDATDTGENESQRASHSENQDESVKKEQALRKSKTEADKVLHSIPRDDQHRNGCARSTALGSRVARIVRG